MTEKINRALSFVVAGIWAYYISAVVLDRILLSPGAGETPIPIFIAFFVFIIVGFFTVYVINKFFLNTNIILILLVLPIVIPIIFPHTKIHPNTYFLNKALAANNPIYCAELTRSGSDCYKKIAENTGNLETCDLINTKEPSNETKWKCYASIASQKNDLSICNQIPVMDQYEWVTNIRNTCIENLSIHSATTNSNSFFCDNIVDKAKKFDCIAKISPQAALKLCSTDAGHFQYQEDDVRCYTNLVYKYNADVNACLLVQAPANDPRPEVYETEKRNCIRYSLSKNPNQVIPEKYSKELSKFRVDLFVNNLASSTPLKYGSTFNFTWNSTGYQYCTINDFYGFSPVDVTEYSRLVSAPKGTLEMRIKSKEEIQQSSIEVKMDCYSIDTTRDRESKSIVISLTD